MQNLVIKRAQLVECKLKDSLAVGRRYKFTDIPNISRLNIALYGIEAYTESQLGVMPSGETLVSAAASINALVTLSDVNNEQFVYRQPVTSLVRANNSGFVTMFEPRIINLTDCYVELSATTNFTADEVIAFTIYYKQLS